MSDTNPSHYDICDCPNCGRTFTCSDVISSLNLSFFIASAFKYLIRGGRKRKSRREIDYEKAINNIYFEVHSHWPWDGQKHGE